ncbi:MAG: hypothetical protein ACRCS9_05105 [Hyphomicrobium sp.]
MTKAATGMARDRLIETLDVFGADRTRWPADRRLELAAYIAQDGEAQRLMRDASRFDALLDLAPVAAGDHQARVDRIVAAAAVTPRVSATSGHDAIAPADAALAKAAARVVPFAARRPAQTLRRNVSAGMALAASLMLGILAGQSQSVTTAMTAVLSDDTAAATASQQLAQSDDVELVFDEDLL